MNKFYGAEPEIICRPLYTVDNFSKYILYLPIKLTGTDKTEDIKISSELNPYRNIISLAVAEEKKRQSIKDLYVYVSAETSPLKAGIYQKRPGWHADGFLTDDVNYIWYDELPTEFCIQKFNVTQCHSTSMKEFEQQALEENVKTYPIETLIRMDQFNVHRTALPTETKQSRTFIKISFSRHKYNLKGNTHNPLLKYDWIMYDRTEVRNCPIKKEQDFVED